MYKTIAKSHNGVINLSQAYTRAIEQPEAIKRRAHLHALKKQLEKMLNITDLEEAKPIHAFELRTRLKGNLLQNGYSPAYARNLNSMLTFMLRYAEGDEAAQDYDEWGAAIDPAIKTITSNATDDKVATNLARARHHMILYFFRNQITRATFESDAHLKGYRQFLKTDCGLNPEGKGRLILKASKSILAKIGYAPETQKVLAQLPEKFLREIAIMGKYATQSVSTTPQSTPIDDPFADTPSDEPGKIRSITWNARRKDIERYLRFWQAQEPKGFEQSNLCDWLNKNRIIEFLTDAFRAKRFSANTAETWISRLVQFMKYANETKVGGFDLPQVELEATTHQIWTLVGKIRKNFRKSTVDERLEKEGGAPEWEELHKNFEAALLTDCTLLERFQIESEKLKKNPLTHAKASVWDLRIALKLRNSIMASFHLYAACRPQDTRATIKTSSLTRISTEYFSLGYLPSKTSGKKKPSVVDMCLPPWMTPLIEIYLERYHHLIYQGTDLLFPADERLKKAHANVAHEGPVRHGNADAAFARMTKAYFGKELSANRMRYSLTNFFSSRELGGLYLLLGHLPDKSMLTDVERGAYERKFAPERLRIAKRHYAEVTELLKNKEKLNEAVNKVKSKLKPA